MRTDRNLVQVQMQGSDVAANKVANCKLNSHYHLLYR